MGSLNIMPSKRKPTVRQRWIENHMKEYGLSKSQATMDWKESEDNPKSPYFEVSNDKPERDRHRDNPEWKEIEKELLHKNNYDSYDKPPKKSTSPKPPPPRKISKWNLFVKEHSKDKDIKRLDPKLRLKALSKKYRATVGFEI